MNNINKKGFTLIELIIVIAIIGVLASVVVLSLGDQTDVAKNAVDVGEASQLRTVALLYSGEKGGDYTDVCTRIKAATGGAVVYGALGDDADPEIHCEDKTSGWYVVWQQEQGGNYSCIGEKGTEAGFEGANVGGLAGALIKCTGITPTQAGLTTEFF